MDSDGSAFRLALIKQILKEDIKNAREEIAYENRPRKVSVIHLQSSTLQRWRNSYMWVKLIALIMLMVGATGIILIGNNFITVSFYGMIGFVGMTVGAAAITYIIGLGERDLGFWRYERIGSKGLIPRYQWQYISWD